MKDERFLGELGHASLLLYDMFKAAGAITDEELVTGSAGFGSRV